MIKVIAFDTFGTVFDMSGVPPEEVSEYGRQLRQEPWAPLRLPKSWEQLPAHPDAGEGIYRLRRNYTVVTCSNGPVDLLVAASKYNHISWDAIVPLALRQIYKPDPRAYQLIAEMMGVPPQAVLMVTANKTFGDLEGARKVGMESILIRGSASPKDIIELSNYLLKGQK